MDGCANIAAERHLVGGALLFWADFAPFADRVREELFSDPELLYIWRAAARGTGVAGCPPALYPLALECLEEYGGAGPDVLIAQLEEVAPRRRLQALAADIVRCLDAGDETGAVIAYVKRRIEAMDIVDA